MGTDSQYSRRLRESVDSRHSSFDGTYPSSSCQLVARHLAGTPDQLSVRSCRRSTTSADSMASNLTSRLCSMDSRVGAGVLPPFPPLLLADNAFASLGPPALA